MHDKEKYLELKFQCLPHCPGLPEYESAGAAGMDVKAADDWISIPPLGGAVLRTGLKPEIPSGYELQIRGRSGLAAKGIYAHFGTVDEDFRGELMVILYNRNAYTYVICSGDRIAQMVLSPVHRALLTRVDELSETARGANGFGSTGV